MEAAIYLDRILERYAGTFDISRKYELDGTLFDAYGYFSSLSEKYVLTRNVNLWSVKAFEHVLFLIVDHVAPEDIAAAADLISGSMQAAFVTKGRKYPEKDHMYSYLTVVLISRFAISKSVESAIRLYRFDKSYLFTVRGYSEGRLVAVDLVNETVFTNKAADKLKKMYEGIFVKQHK